MEFKNQIDIKILLKLSLQVLLFILAVKSCVKDYKPSFGTRLLICCTSYMVRALNLINFEPTIKES